MKTLRELWTLFTQKLPIWFLQMVVWLLIHVLYRIRAVGLEHIPREGAVIVACNHVSFVDALLLGGLMPRAPRFVMYHKIYRVPVLNLLFRTARVIPIAPAKEDAELLSRAYMEIEEARGRADAGRRDSDLQVRHREDLGEKPGAGGADGAHQSLGQHVEPAGLAPAPRAAAEAIPRRHRPAHRPADPVRAGDGRSAGDRDPRAARRRRLSDFQ